MKVADMLLHTRVVENNMIYKSRCTLLCGLAIGSKMRSYDLLVNNNSSLVLVVRLSILLLAGTPPSVDLFC
jgi:hypothetical protein